MIQSQNAGKGGAEGSKSEQKGKKIKKGRNPEERKMEQGVGGGGWEFIQGEPI